MSAIAPAMPLPAACVACGSRALVVAETVSADSLAAAWLREDEVTGTPARLERAEALASTLPPEIRFDRCTDCGLEMAEPAVMWPAHSYPRDQSYPVRWEFGRAVSDLGRGPRDVLEIGCGTGHFLAAASAHGHRAVGVDFSDVAVAEAQARGLRAYCGSADALADILGDDARFDAVACFHVIEHLPDPSALFNVAARWMRPGGRLLVSCPGPRRFTRLIPEQRAGSSDFWDYPPQHVLRWTLAALRAAATRHGWRVVDAVEEPFSWVAAASHIGAVRAMYRSALDHPVARRTSIAAAWLKLLCHPKHRAGVSLYLNAVRGTGPQ